MEATEHNEADLYNLWVDAGPVFTISSLPILVVQLSRASSRNYHTDRRLVARVRSAAQTVKMTFLTALSDSELISLKQDWQQWHMTFCTQARASTERLRERSYRAMKMLKQV